jgi:LysM repeat protein
MKFKILLTSAFFLFLSTALFAKPVVDSVGVRNDDGKKVVQYKIKAGDTYYSIGKRYHIKPEAIMKYNGFKKATLTIGKVIDVPTSMSFKGSSKAKETADEPKKESAKEKKERLAQEAKEEREKKKHKHAADDNDETTDEPVSPKVDPVPVEPKPIQQAVQPPVQQPVQQPVQNNTPPFQYKVSAGETLYAISKRFNTTVDALTSLNNLTSTNIQPGQLLMVQSGNAAAPAQTQPQQSVVAVNPNPIVKRDSTSVVIINKDSVDRHLNANRFGLFEKNEKGVATWMDDPGLDPNKKLVLHRTAPIGTVIKITNPMTNRTTFAKVVGRFTDNESTKDVIIVMTKNVADALGALDKRFHVDISYGSPNE